MKKQIKTLIKEDLIKLDIIEKGEKIDLEKSSEGFYFCETENYSYVIHVDYKTYEKHTIERFEEWDMAQYCSPNFIADLTGVPSEWIETLQENEAIESDDIIHMMHKHLKEDQIKRTFQIWDAYDEVWGEDRLTITDNDFYIIEE